MKPEHERTCVIHLGDRQVEVLVEGVHHALALLQQTKQQGAGTVC